MRRTLEMNGPAARAAIIVLAVAANACSRHASATRSIKDVVGCYELTRLEWIPMPGTVESISLYSPPSVIRLTSDSAVSGGELLVAKSEGSTEDDGYLIKPGPGAKTPNESFQEGTWRLRDRKVLLQWPPGPGEVQFATIRHGNNLEGAGRALSGENALGSKGYIQLRRIRCQP